MSDKTERTKEEILSELTGIPIYRLLADDNGEYITKSGALKAMEEYRQSSPVEKWVKITEQKPDQGTRVLIAYKFGVAEGFYWGGQFLKDLQTPFPEPTHWQPLPELPPIEEPKEK